MENKILFLGPSDSPVFVWLQKNGENILSTVDKITVDYIINTPLKIHAANLPILRHSS